MNKCLFSGRVVATPEIHMGRENPQNKIARFRLAVRDPYLRNDDEKNTAFINCVVLNSTRADWFEKNVEAGDALIVTCSFRPSDYVDKDGVKKYSYDFIINEAEFNESKEAKNARKAKQAQAPVYGQAPVYPPQQAPQQAPAYGQTPAYPPQQAPQQAPQQPIAPIIPGASMIGLGIPDDELPFN